MAPNTDSPDKPAETTHFGYRNVPADDLIELSPLDAMGPADLC